MHKVQGVGRQPEDAVPLYLKRADYSAFQYEEDGEAGGGAGDAYRQVGLEISFGGGQRLGRVCATCGVGIRYRVMRRSIYRSHCVICSAANLRAASTRAPQYSNWYVFCTYS